MGGDQVTEPLPQCVRFHVCVLPEDAQDRYMFTITVDYRGKGRWGVYEGAYEYTTLPRALDADLEWDYEGSEQRQDEDWLAAHRFPLDVALDLAKRKAPDVGFYSHRHQRFVSARDVLEEG